MARFAATNSICVRTHNIVLVKVSNVCSTAVLVLAKSDSDSVRKLDFYYIQNSSDLAHFFMKTLFFQYFFYFFLKKIVFLVLSLSSGPKWPKITFNFVWLEYNEANQSFMFDWTHFQRKLMISGNSYKLSNEMKFFQSNFISFCLVRIQ